MTTHIVARFADGKLLVQEQKAPDQVNYLGTTGVTSGMNAIAVRMGGICHIEKILSVATNLEKNGLVSPLGATSSKLDTAYVRLFRGDIGFQGGPVASGDTWGLSGAAGIGPVSALTSGLAWMGEVVSSATVSGIGLLVTVNAVGW